MGNKNLDKIVEEQMEKSEEFFKGKSKFTKKQLDAIDTFVDKKNELFEKILSSPEQLEKAQRMLKKLS